MRDAQLVMLGNFLEREPDEDRRKAPRRVLSLQVPSGSAPGGGSIVLIHDLSSTGLLLETATSLDIGSPVAIELPHAGRCAATVVWDSGSLFGCQFDTPIPKAAVSAALLLSPAAHEQRGSGARDFGPWTAAEGEADKLPLRTRLWIHIGLAAASACLIAGAIALAW
jgi:hypothetical protein